jgi:hypothetical protein
MNEEKVIAMFWIIGEDRFRKRISAGGAGAHQHLAAREGVERANCDVPRRSITTRGQNSERGEHSGARNDAGHCLLAESGTVVDDKRGVLLRHTSIGMQKLRKALKEAMGLRNFVAIP